ncbi:MAG: chromosome segregation protein SMC [Clostridia bacterium]|nr:chromosome segregation protein SMC [Clostridia bacterium]
MYLKSLELHGFKSFPDRTKITFDVTGAVTGTTGITVIVGPNGSGKSNLADAMRWVLGEMRGKSLRSTKMEDVIFLGSGERKPMGIAEVSVTFDNTAGEGRLDCPYDEVTVTRRYYRAGESEYFLNRKPVRLRDIQELFMNTGLGRDGYSIIGQGRVAELLSRKSEDRRSVFEDAAGIAKFRKRKEEAENKLASTEDNMTRVRDIFAEVESRVEPLEKEAAKAKKFIELSERKKEADISLWLFDTKKIREDLAEAEERFNASSEELQKITDEITELDIQVDRLTETINGGKRDAEKLLDEITRLQSESSDLKSNLKVTENNIQHNRELIAETEAAISSLNQSRDRELQTREKYLADYNGSLARKTALEKERGEIAERAEKNGAAIAEAEKELEASWDRINELTEQLTEIRMRISTLKGAQEGNAGKNDSINEELEEYRSASQELEKDMNARDKTVSGYRKQVEDMQAIQTGAEEELEKAQDELQQAREKLQALQLRKQTAANRIDTYHDMEQTYEGYMGAVRYVMNKYQEGEVKNASGQACGTIYGPLSKVISVKDEYVTAIETALGANLQNIVVEDEETAKAAMYTLKKGEAGRATFFPLTSMKPSQPGTEVQEAGRYEGYIGIADTLVSCDGKFSNVISSLLGRTVVFDTIDHATVMAKAQRYRVRTVTLDGQQINVGGSFTGGSFKQNGSLLGRAAAVRKLEEELAALDGQIKAEEKTVSERQQTVNDLADRAADAETQAGLLTTLYNSELAKYEQARARYEANQSLLEKMEADWREMTEQQAHSKEQIKTLEGEEKETAEALENEKQARVDKDAERNGLLQEQDDMQRRDTQITIEINAAEKDMESANQLAQDCQSRINAFAEDIWNREEKKSSYERAIDNLLHTQQTGIDTEKESASKLLDLQAQRSAILEKNVEYEAEQGRISRLRHEKQESKELLINENTKNENSLSTMRERQESLSGQLWEDYEMTGNEALAQGYRPVEAKDRAAVAKIQIECRNKIRVMGSVDTNAIEEYKEVKERYDSMKVQIDDLEKSKVELTGIISQLEAEMKSSFMDAFQKINENFAITFSELFGGGFAQISLTDEEDILGSGIEIQAEPPGKVIKSLLQLSGGEQSLVSIALLFAILRVNPTPFCILDEIDAALDETNVDRLAAYIKRYTDDTQFIVITHKRGTMEAADRLYGVTMESKGISKILVLDVNDIAKKKEGEWDGLFS